MIDFNNVYEALITSVSDSIGDQLSVIQSPYSPARPSVIRAREKGPRPELSYVTVDLINTRLPSGWLLNTEVERVDDDLIRTTHHVLYEIFFNFECFSDDAVQLLTQYKSEYQVPDGVRYQIRRDAGLSSQSFSDVQSIPKLLNTDYEERSKLSISYYIHDVIQRESNCIERITGSGVIVDAEGQPIQTIDIDTDKAKP